MKVVLFGASGMVGQAVLRECLRDGEITAVVSFVRRKSGQSHAKLNEIDHSDFHDFGMHEDLLSSVDICFFAIGVGSAGMGEEQYRRVTYEIPIAAAWALKKKSPDAAFVFVSAAGADSSEKGRVMWARAKGAAENQLMRLFPRTYVFRPALIQPLHGIQSRTRIYRILYSLTRPLLPLIVRMFPKHATTTDQMGRAMLHVGKRGWGKKILEARDINQVS